uniref:Arogenate dehydratase n=1 Tax=Wollemia nobilis TaxID=56998 RepID=A0A0C9QND5_9CONI
METASISSGAYANIPTAKLNANIRFAFFKSKIKPCGSGGGKISVKYALRCALDSGDDMENIGALELQHSSAEGKENGESDFTSRDSNTLPRPLSISDLSVPVSHRSQLRVAYQGVPGAFSEAAAAKAYPNCEAVPCEQFETAFEAVELWLVDRAVLPIENSLGGSIHRNYDLLLRHRLHIVGEVQLAVHHCLLGVHGVKKEELRRVLSHPQALSQCEHTLLKLGVIREAVDDTAGAAQFVALHKLRDTGAVASARAAEIYGLDILAKDIQDVSDNVTRFLMLAREPIIPRVDRPFKTSIVFSLEEGPGILFKALAVFAMREINLTKIESRPQRKRPLRVTDGCSNGSAKYFDYLFYVDFEASMADARAQNALGHLQEFATFMRVLGSYPMDVSPSD